MVYSYLAFRSQLLQVTGRVGVTRRCPQPQLADDRPVCKAKNDERYEICRRQYEECVRTAPDVAVRFWPDFDAIHILSTATTTTRPKLNNNNNVLKSIYTGLGLLA